MKKSITKTERTYVVYDTNEFIVGIWHSPKQLLSDLRISTSTALYRSINDDCYILNNINEKKKYKIVLFKDKVKTTVEVTPTYTKKDKPYSDYLKTRREYVSELPADAKAIDYMPEITGLYACPNGTLYGTDINGIYVITPYLNKCSTKHNHNKHGYYRFHYQKKIFRVHNVLARAFVPGYKDGLVVDHINGNSTDNRLENLQWLSISDNTKKYHAQEVTPEERAEKIERIRQGQLRRWNAIPKEERWKYSNLRRRTEE